ncbi:MAG TPA: tRNA (adenosine(37)-N6)-threonylcarbamoyltransferase complex dimerization subunit type 1 TsaB [Jatrophihabitans sp.]
MLVLVIDTSSAAVTAGIVEISATERAEDIGVRAEQTTIDGKSHGELLTPSIKQALQASKLAMSDLTAVIAGVGPGPFTGLRVGLITAAAISDALQIPSYGVCSLDAIASTALTNDRLLVATDARRREVYWAVYYNGVREGEPNVGKAAELTVDAAAMAGAGARQYQDVLGLPLLDNDYPTVVGLARCAADRVRNHAPAELLVPLYLRRPDAVEPAARKSVINR